MSRRLWTTTLVVGLGLAPLLTSVFALQPPPGNGQPPGGFQPGGQPPGGFQPGGRGGPGGMMGGQERKLVADFDKDKNGWLNQEERAAAREFLKKERSGGGARPGGGFPGGPGGGFPGGPGGRGNQEPAKPGPKVAPADVKAYPSSNLYEPTVLRAFFLEFENKDWEAELVDFHNTDVEVPATLTVDGKKYPNVGVHFRGMSSYGGVPAGYKRSLNLTMDLADSKQRLYGYKTLNLLNAHGDPSYLSSVLYSTIARQYIPAPKANLAKVVINGESWGVYANVQQFNKEFLAENYKTTKGARWKVSGSPGGGGGLEYLGENVEDYKRRYEIKSGDDKKAWTALIKLCKTLNQTPTDQLEAALKPMVDLDGLLWFLALDVALINDDGYWIRASDYSIFLDEKNKFHFIPHDMNESFRAAGGPGFGGMGGGRGGFAMPKPGEILPIPLQDSLRLTDEQKKLLAELQKDTDGKLGKILTADQVKQLKEMQERGPGGFGGPGGGGPGGFGPGGGPGGPPGGGPGGFGGGPGGGGGVELDPLVALNDSRKPLRSKVLAVPSLRTKYLQNVRKIADEWLDWKKLGPLVAQYRQLIEKEVEADTKKLDSFEAFKRTTADEATGGNRGREMALRTFADSRRKYLLDNADIKKASASPEEPKKEEKKP